MNGNDASSVYGSRQKVGLFLGPGLFFLILILPLSSSMPLEAQRTAAVGALMATWWLSEALPIAATALLPLVLFPLLGIRDMTETSASYGDRNVYLFFGGFLLAAAMEKCKLHLRIAYAIIIKVGRDPATLILGFLISTAFLSMGISNTATTLMMLPIALAVINVVSQINQKETQRLSQFGTALLLAIAYGASVGGMGTIIGTPPNIIFASSAASLYPDLKEIGFLDWMLFAVPITIVFIPVIWLLLTKVIFKFDGIAFKGARDSLKEKQKLLGSLKPDEKKVLVIALFTAFGWIFRKDLVLGSFTIPGWSNIFPNPAYIHDATVAIFAAVVLFLTPTDRKFSGFLLTWNEAKKIPWGILILFGGGIALAGGFSSSGLSVWMGESLQVLDGLPVWLFIFTVALVMTFLTEVTSNIATASLFMPIMGGLAVAIGMHPYLLMLPAVISASCAFMLPVATPPNAIVFSSGKISMMQMARAGIILNIIGAVLVTIVIYFFAAPLLGL